MATAVIPKSEARRNDNISVGYGEVPAVMVEEQLGWGMPGGNVTFCRDRATSFAKDLDAEIRRTLKHPKQLLTAA